MNYTLSQRRDLVDKRDAQFSIQTQCNMLGIHRSGLHYAPKCESAENLVLMRMIDEQYLKTPFYGVPRMTAWLNRQGCKVNRKRIARLYQLMGLQAIYPRKFLSQPNKQHYKYPYLLQDLVISYPNQAWACDITYVPMNRGFMYLVAIIDLYSRYIVGWRVSNSLDVSFCVVALEESIGIQGTPSIFNTDQGSQFTCQAFIASLQGYQIKISMDGKGHRGNGRAIDNVFIERFWRSIKYENIYLRTYQDGWDLEEGISQYIDFYNKERIHQSLNYKTPQEVYENVSLKNVNSLS